MSSYNCLGCGVLLAPHVYECPICGYDNRFGPTQEGPGEDDFLMGFAEEIPPENDPGY